MQRDVRDIASVEKLDHLSRLLRVMATMSSELCNFTEMSGQAGLDTKTAAKYLAVSERTFLPVGERHWAAPISTPWHN